MKYLLQFLLAIGLGFLLAGTVLAADPPANGVEISMSVSLPLPDYDTIFHDNGDENDPESLTIRQLEWLDRAWACRDKDFQENYHLVLLEDSILLADEQAQGSRSCITRRVMAFVPTVPNHTQTQDPGRRPCKYVYSQWQLNQSTVLAKLPCFLMRLAI